ncbi:hypothetical protein L7F22_004286 [Adiantum nelumboides]|nr:hypothetical protein [Adiantum nelumboides]
MEDSVNWEQAMKLEYNIIANETWELTKLPQGKQVLPCKWVYKKKYTTEEPKPKYKARLVAKEGVDFDVIFSLVVKMTTLCLVLGLVATEDLELNQMDVKTVFLHGDLEEDVYMVEPEGFEMESKKPKRAKLACRLCKALYGLKQGSRQWTPDFGDHSQDYHMIMGRPWLRQAKVKHNWEANMLTMRKGRRKIRVMLGTCRQLVQSAWPVIAKIVIMVEGLEEDEEEQFLKANPDLVSLYLADVSMIAGKKLLWGQEVAVSKRNEDALPKPKSLEEVIRQECDF